MKILFLTGPHAVGKSYFMQQLATTNNFFQFDTGPEMRRMHKESLSEKNIGEWVNELEKAYGPLVTCDMLCKVLESRERDTDNIIITGFRQIEGIEYMINYFQPENYEILYIDGIFELLKNNFILRENRNISDEDFQKYLLSEEEWGLRNLKDYVLNNPSNCRYIKKQSNSDVITTDIFKNNKVLKLNYKGVQND